jgi:hypothetical protein
VILESFQLDDEMLLPRGEFDGIKVNIIAFGADAKSAMTNAPMRMVGLKMRRCWACLLKLIGLPLDTLS